MRRAQEEGLVKHVGMSFHDTPENMVRLIDTGVFELVTCQYNYLDRVNSEAMAYAHEKGLGVVVMGPVGGGRLSIMPKKLRELQRLFLIEAAKYNVLPLDDRKVERFNPDLAGRPTLVKGNRQLLFKGMGRLNENAVLNTKNKSHSITAEIEVPEAGAEGVIVA